MDCCCFCATGAVDGGCGTTGLSSVPVKALADLRVVFVDDEGANCRLGLRLLAKLGIPAANVTVLHDGRGQGTSVHNHVTHGRTWRWLCQTCRSHKHEHASAHADTPRHILTHTLKLTDADTHRRTRRHSQTHRHPHTGTPRTTTQTHIHTCTVCGHAPFLHRCM